MGIKDIVRRAEDVEKELRSQGVQKNFLYPRQFSYFLEVYEMEFVEKK